MKLVLAQKGLIDGAGVRVSKLLVPFAMNVLLVPAGPLINTTLVFLSKMILSKFSCFSVRVNYT